LPFFYAYNLIHRMPNSLAAKPDMNLEPTWVICLCAAWCGVCRDYEQVFAQMAARYPAFRFVWLDVEDQAELVGDIDVETFPTVLLTDAQTTWFFGPVTPQANTLSRLLDSLQNASLQALPQNPAARQLLHALHGAPAHWIRP